MKMIKFSSIILDYYLCIELPLKQFDKFSTMQGVEWYGSSGTDEISLALHYVVSEQV